MSSFAPVLRPFLLLILFILVASIGNLAIASETAAAKKSATASKSAADKPWQISLTEQRSRQTFKPILSPLGQGTFGNVMPSLFADQPVSADSIGVSPYFALPSMEPSAPTAFGFQGRTPLSFDTVGLQGSSSPIPGILDSSPPLPTILGSTVLGDATGNGEIDFVDRSNALIPMESSSPAMQFGSGE